MQAVVKVLRNPPRAASESTFRPRFDALTPDPRAADATLRGAIGFVLFTLAADAHGPPAWGTRPSAESAARAESAAAALVTANALLEDAEVLGFAYQIYGFVPKAEGRDYVGAPVRLLAVGTTSYILSIRVGRGVVLKLVQPRYFDIAGIEQATLHYANLVAGIQDAPKVHECRERYILMDLVRGVTLGKYLRNLAASADGFDATSLTSVRDIFVSICSRLDILSDQDLSHGDVSLDNIIVTQDVGPGGKTHCSSAAAAAFDRTSK